MPKATKQKEGQSMTPLSKEILDNFQVRKSKKQKDAFIKLLQSHYPEMQIQEGGFAKSRNLIVGNIQQSEYVLTAHYDTCAQLPFPNFIAPKKPLLSIAYSILIAIPVLLIMALGIALLRLLSNNFWVCYLGTLALYFGVFYLMLCGPANKHTANDNTSGIITLCELYARLTAVERSKVALVFFDNEESGLLGSRLFKKEYQKRMRQKLLINFDCVSDGSNILIAVSKGARGKWDLEKHFPTLDTKKLLLEQAEKVFYPSDQLGFPNTVAVAALKHSKLLGYYMDRIHTKRDTQFDETNIDFLCAGIKSLVAHSVATVTGEK